MKADNGILNYHFFQLYIYIYAYICFCHSIKILRLDKVAYCCGGKEEYHTYATVIYIITVWRVE